MATQSQRQLDSQLDMMDDSVSENAHAVDIGSLDPEYLSVCVRFAQSHGILPTSLWRQQNISIPLDGPMRPIQPFNQQHSTEGDHLDLGPNQFDDRHMEQYGSNTTASLNYAQVNDGKYSDL